MSSGVKVVSNCFFGRTVAKRHINGISEAEHRSKRTHRRRTAPGEDHDHSRAQVDDQRGHHPLRCHPRPRSVHLGIDARAVTKAIAEGTFPALLIGSHTFILREPFIAILEGKSVNASWSGLALIGHTNRASRANLDEGLHHHVSPRRITAPSYPSATRFKESTT